MRSTSGRFAAATVALTLLSAPGARRANAQEGVYELRRRGGGEGFTFANLGAKERTASAE